VVRVFFFTQRSGVAGNVKCKMEYVKCKTGSMLLVLPQSHKEHKTSGLFLLAAGAI
jgi:hypothetical protein